MVEESAPRPLDGSGGTRRAGTDLQHQARALGDPTRHRVFRFVADADRPVGVAELTEHFGFNHNAIRQHLAKLVEAGLLLETTAPPTGRGRPRLEYVPDPSADSRWGVVGPYERLSVLLTEVVATGEPPVEIGRRAGRELVSGPGGGDPVSDLVEQMARQGFEPTVARKGRTVEVVLDVCPFATAALTDPDTVCDLHLGLAQGIAESVDGLVIDELVRKDPRRARCRLRCHLAEPA